MENNGQIDLLALIKKLWIQKVFIFRTTMIFLLLGLLIALLSPKTYTAGSTLVPMMSSDQKANG